MTEEWDYNAECGWSAGPYKSPDAFREHDKAQVSRAPIRGKKRGLFDIYSHLTYNRSYKTLYVTYIWQILACEPQFWFLENVTSYECENSEIMSRSSKVFSTSIISPVIWNNSVHGGSIKSFLLYLCACTCVCVLLWLWLKMTLNTNWLEASWCWQKSAINITAKWQKIFPAVTTH